MPLASTIAAYVLSSLAASSMPVRASFPIVVQASQSEAQQDNSSPQQPAAQDASPAPPPAAAPEHKPPPNEPPPDAVKPGQAGESAPSTVPVEPTPAAGPEPQSAPPAPAMEEPKTEPPQPPKKKSASPTKRRTAAKRRTAHRTQKAKPATASAKPGTPNKVVVKNGSAAEPSVQLAPGLSQQQASTQRQGTSQLLASTDENLKKISGRQLASNQQEMVQQIRKYMEQAKTATDAGDLDRAHNLALKASLLAQELAKP